MPKAPNPPSDAPEKEIVIKFLEPCESTLAKTLTKIEAAAIGPDSKYKGVYELTDDELAHEYYWLRDLEKAIEERYSFVKSRLIEGLQEGTCYISGDRRIMLQEFERAFFKAKEALKAGVLSQNDFDRFSSASKIRRLYTEGQDEIREG